MANYNQFSDVVPNQSDVDETINQFNKESEATKKIVAILAPFCQRDQARLLDTVLLLKSIGSEQKGVSDDY